MKRLNTLSGVLMVCTAVALPACSTDDTAPATTSGSDAGAEACALPGSQDEIVSVYGSAWNEPDAEKRLCALEASLSPDVTYIDPTIDTTTREGLSDAIGAFFESAPGAAIVQTSALDLREGELRFTWDFANDGVTAIHGLDYMELDADGRITSIRGYWDPLPTAMPEGTLGDYVTGCTTSDDAERARLLAGSVTATARFSAASGAGTGPTAVAFEASSTVTFSGAQAYPKFARVVFDVTTGGTTTKVTDYLHLDADGKITRVARFDGDFPPL